MQCNETEQLPMSPPASSFSCLPSTPSSAAASAPRRGDLGRLRLRGGAAIHCRASGYPERWQISIDLLVQGLKRHTLRPLDSGRDASATIGCPSSGVNTSKDSMLPGQQEAWMQVDRRNLDGLSRSIDRRRGTPLQSPLLDLWQSDPARPLFVNTPPQMSSQAHGPSDSPPLNGVLIKHCSIMADAATEDTSYDYIQVDEGYVEGADEPEGLQDGHDLIRSLARHARHSGVLKYRTSAEVALQCPQVVQRAPRMRRRKHKNRASTSATLDKFNRGRWHP